MTSTEIIFLSLIAVILIADMILKRFAESLINAQSQTIDNQTEVIVKLQKEILGIENKNKHIYKLLTELILDLSVRNQDYETAQKCKEILTNPKLDNF